MNKQTPEFGDWSWSRLGDRGCDGYGRQRKEELLDCAEHFTKFGEDKAAKEIEALKADQATRAEAVAALIRDCETAEKERDRLRETLERVLHECGNDLSGSAKKFIKAALNHKEG